jgi:hypothetical protein
MLEVQQVHGLGARIPSILGGIGAGVGSAGLFLAQLAGEQGASAPEQVFVPINGQITPIGVNTTTTPETGFEQIEKIGKDISFHINNYINSPTPQEMIDDIVNQTKQALTFGNQQSGGG